MLEPKLSNSFKKNYKLMIKRGLDISKLDKVIDEYLLPQKPIPPQYKDHQLKGNMREYRELHIEPDWLLIYKIDGINLLLYLERTGSHSDLFE